MVHLFNLQTPCVSVIHAVRVPLLVCVLMLIASGVNAQTTWKRYSVKGEQFSVSLPTVPAMDYRKVRVDDRGQRLEISLGSYANGVVYTVFVFENLSPRESLDSFSDRFGRGRRTLDLTSERKLTVNGVNGKAFTWEDGVVQFFARGNRLFQFMAFGAPPDDQRIGEFFSSVSLLKNKDVVEVSEGPGEPYVPNAEAGLSSSAADQQAYVGKEVDRKVRLAMKPEPPYTELARQHQVTGTVVIKCVFSSNGSVTNIRVVSGLSDGLTERAIAAAKKIKFIPAIKDGKYVSMWIQLEYNFNLY